MRGMFALAAVAGIAAGASAGTMDERWVYVTDPIVSEDCVERISNAVVTAKAGGMNGMLLEGNLDFYRNWPYERCKWFKRIKQICDDAGIEIIPAIWGLGYGGMQSYDLNLVEGVPVEGVPFVVEGTNAVFDEAAAKTMELDTKSGFQRIEDYRRLIKKVSVTPHRRYRYSFEFRTKGLKGSQPFRVLAVNAKVKGFFEQETLKVDYRPTQDWTPCELKFCSSDCDSYYLYIGFMRGWQEGDFELRNVKLTEVAPSQVVQRPGTPRRLRNAATGEVYEEGRDYTVPNMTYPMTRQDRPMVKLALPPGSRVKAGDRLIFDSYTPPVANGGQVSTCLSDPKLYEAFADSAAQIEELLHPKKWFFSMDEFRNGGTCAACKARGMTMAEMYGDAVTKAFGIVRKVHPGADVYIWSDMLDPNHNAVKHYYNCVGSFEESWKYVPKDLIICCWYGEKADISMPFFSSHGFRTLAAAYYDEKPPFKYSRKWRDVVLDTKGALGIMYTTWKKSYGDLPAFCDMLKEK